MGKAPSEVGSPRNPYFTAPYPNSLTNDLKAPLATQMYKEPLPGTPPTPKIVEPLEAPAYEALQPSKPATLPTVANGTRSASAVTTGTGKNPYITPMKVIKFARTVANAQQGNKMSPQTARVSTPRSRTHSPFSGENHQRAMTPVGDSMFTGGQTNDGSPKGAPKQNLRI